MKIIWLEIFIKSSVVISYLKVIEDTYLIESFRRKFLKKRNLDYPHGTGHGVGFFLNVHEGPQSISKFNRVKLKEGMILSNEPGYYFKNKYVWYYFCNNTNLLNHSVLYQGFFFKFYLIYEVDICSCNNNNFSSKVWTIYFRLH